MSKDLSMKNFRLEANHGFKKFDSEKRGPMLYPDSSAEVRPVGHASNELRVSHPLHESPAGLSGPSGLMQQQRHRQLSHPQQRVASISDQQQQAQHHRQLPLGGPMGQHQQVYGDPGDYLRLASGQSTVGMSGMATASSLLGLDPSLGVGPPYSYEDLDLSDPETTNALLMRNDLMVTSDSLIHQREQDLNLVSSTPPAMPSSSSSMPVPGFLVPNRSVLAARSGLLGSHDPLAMLFDHPSLPQASGYTTGVGNTSSIFTSSSGGLLSHTSSSSSNFLMDAGGNGSSFNSGNIGPNATPLNGNSRSGGNSNGAGHRPHQQQQQQQQNAPPQHPLASSSTFLVKQEADEGHFVDEDDSLSRSSINSPTKSDPSLDARTFAAPSGSDDRKRGMKRTLSNCSASSTGGGPDGGDANTSKSSPSSQSDRNGGGTSCGAGEALSPGTSGDISKFPPNGSDNLKELDPAYLEKRRKNNESAKRSREARRTKEELVAFKVINLEEENMKLRAEIRLLDKELDELRTRLYQCN